jgi:hypothetical protein
VVGNAQGKGTPESHQHLRRGVQAVGLGPQPYLAIRRLKHHGSWDDVPLGNLERRLQHDVERPPAWGQGEPFENELKHIELIHHGAEITLRVSCANGVLRDL